MPENVSFTTTDTHTLPSCVSQAAGCIYLHDKKRTCNNEGMVTQTLLLDHYRVKTRHHYSSAASLTSSQQRQVQALPHGTGAHVPQDSKDPSSPLTETHTNKKVTCILSRDHENFLVCHSRRASASSTHSISSITGV